MRRLVRGFVAVVLFTLALPSLAATASEFYLAMLQKGVAAYDAGRFDAAATSLRIAAFGFVESVEHYQIAQMYLALTYDKLGDAELARRAARSLVTAERIEARYASLQLPAATRTSFEGVARKLLTPADFALLERPAQSAPPRAATNVPPATSATTAQTTPSQPQTTPAPPQTQPRTATQTPPRTQPQTTQPQTSAQTQPQAPPGTQPRTTQPQTAPQTSTQTPAQSTITTAPPAATEPPATSTPAPATPSATTPAPPSNPATQQPSNPATSQPRTPPTSQPRNPATQQPATPGTPPPTTAARFTAAEQALTAARLSDARAIYRELLEHPTLQHDELLRLAEGFYRARDFVHALRAFDRLGPLRRGEEPYRYYIAVALYETGQYARAKQELAAVLPYIEVTPDVARYRTKIEGAVN